MVLELFYTNLGRAIFSERVAERLKTIVTGYSNLEFDLTTGGRGSRYQLLEEITVRLQELRGAMLVNNNAAAVILCLNEFAKNKKTIVSRGELVEIGGSFRIPETISLPKILILPITSVVPIFRCILWLFLS